MPIDKKAAHFQVESSLFHQKRRVHQVLASGAYDVWTPHVVSGAVRAHAVILEMA